MYHIITLNRTSHILCKVSDTAAMSDNSYRFGQPALSRVDAHEWDIFNQLNTLRTEGFTCPGGRRYTPNNIPLKFDCRLWKASKLHSKDMGNRNYVDHMSPDGRSFNDRAKEQGALANAENIAWYWDTPKKVLEQWKRSEGHCDNMMNPGAKLFGAGYYYTKSNYQHYWTQLFSFSNDSKLDNTCYPNEN